MKQITITTFNTWNCQGALKRRLPLMSEGLRAVNADVVLLQEVFAQAPAGLHVGQVLADALEMYLIYAPARKKWRTFDGVPTLCHSGLAVLSKSPILSARTLRLPMDERDGERLGQIVDIGLKGLNVRVGNVHLTHLKSATALRRAQLDRLAQNLEDAAAPDTCAHKTPDLTIVGGDMNAPVGASVFDVLDGYHPPIYATATPKTTLNPVNGVTTEPQVIDHVFVRAPSGREIGINAHVALDAPDGQPGLYPSDHKAVVTYVDVA